VHIKESQRAKRWRQVLCAVYHTAIFMAESQVSIL